VDIFGLDVYSKSLTPHIPAIRSLVERAEARGKIPALTEAGYPGGLSECAEPDFFTRRLLAPLRDDPAARRVAWVLLWRNADESHFWVPPPSHPLADDFRAFYRDPFTVFCDTLPGLPAGNGPAPPE
jgi:mannan endo-1,4-beta-mannosidase